MKNVLLPKSGGYTFIELLVAITILGIVIAPFLGLLTSGFSSIAAAGRKTTAINLAREEMETIKAVGYDFAYDYFITAGNSPFTENIIPLWPQYRRVTEVYPLELEEELLSDAELLSIRITVYWTMHETVFSEALESTLCRR